MDVELAKKEAGIAAVQFIESGMRVGAVLVQRSNILSLRLTPYVRMDLM